MARFQPVEMLRVLEQHRVRYVLIGGLAATLHGSPLRTGDADICPAGDRENLDNLAAALQVMNAGLTAQRDPAPRWAWNQSQVRRISSRRFSGFVSPCPSPAYTTSSVFTPRVRSARQNS